jgi:hypothetical protein
MKNVSKMRKWATPVTIGAFILSAVTGIMLLFKVNIGMTKQVHEWLSLILVAGTIFHVMANWRLFTGYFSSRLGWIIIGAFLFITCASMVPLDDRKAGQNNRASEVLVRTPLSSVAMTAGHSPDEAMTMLNEKGVKVEGIGQSIGEIAGKNGKAPVYVLDIIF